MEMRLRAPVTRGYFFLLGALRLVNAASPRNIDQKKISSGTLGRQRVASLVKFYTNQKFFLQSAEKPRYEFSARVLRRICKQRFFQ